MPLTGTIISLNGKSLEENISFFGKFCNFKIDHYRAVTINAVTNIKNNGAKIIGINDFFRNFVNHKSEIAFGNPEDRIMIYSYYEKGLHKFSLWDIIDSKHKLGVVDAYTSVYREELPKDI